jgi:hypothetical protein
MFYNPPGFTPGSPFGASRRIDGGKPHGGLDYRGAAGTPVPAALGGKVIYSGLFSNYGYVVGIQDASGNYELYAHLDSAGLPAVGTTVNAGDSIGQVGSLALDRSVGALVEAPHLHFEVIMAGHWGAKSSQVQWRADPATYDPNNPIFGVAPPPLPTTNTVAAKSKNPDVMALSAVDLNSPVWEYVGEDDSKLNYVNSSTGQQLKVAVDQSASTTSNNTIRFIYELYDATGALTGKRIVTGNFNPGTQVFNPLRSEFYDHNGKLVEVRKEAALAVETPFDFAASDISGNSVDLNYVDGVDTATRGIAQVSLQSDDADFVVNDDGTIGVDGSREKVTFGGNGAAAGSASSTIGLDTFSIDTSAMSGTILTAGSASGGAMELTSHGISSSATPVLTVLRDTDSGSGQPIERLVLSSGADTLKVDAGANLKAIREIDGGDNPEGLKDILDLSSYGAKLEIIEPVPEIWTGR